MPREPVPLHTIFVDESGDIGLSDRAKKRPYFVLGFVYCRDPGQLRKRLKRLLKKLHLTGKYPETTSGIEILSSLYRADSERVYGLRTEFEIPNTTANGKVEGYCVDIQTLRLYLLL